MQLDTDNQSNSAGIFSQRLFKIEKATGFMILGSCALYLILDLLGFGLELRGVQNLLPLLFAFSAPTLLLAGGGSERCPAFAALLHVPLIIWLIIFALALI